MGSVEKVSVSLASDELSWARARAKRQDKSLSAVLSDALQQQRQAEARWALLEDLGLKDISSSEVDALRREMVGAKRPATKRKTSAKAKR